MEADKSHVLTSPPLAGGFDLRLNGLSWAAGGLLSHKGLVNRSHWKRSKPEPPYGSAQRSHHYNRHKGQERTEKNVN